LDYISSAGLRSILMAAKQVKAKNGRLLIAGMKEAVREVFNLSGFFSILHICETEEDALKELR
jgi:anti-anti-sigma factor